MFSTHQVNAVYVDQGDYAAVVQRLLAAGAIAFRDVPYALAAGRLDLGGLGLLGRYEFVPASERPRAEWDGGLASWTEYTDWLRRAG
ncbi:MAG: hypothetical protein AB7I04_18340 [Pseudomonadales bacterium]